MSVEHTLLAVLSIWPSTGYNIKSEFEHKAAGLYWGMSYGSIYPKLKKLEEDGFIYTLEQEEEGRKKKLYELTPEGWEEFENWLKAPPSYPVIKDELLMKMSTWHEDMDYDDLISHLLKRKEQTEDLLEFVKEWPKNGYSYISKLGILTIRFIEMRLETELRWIEESLVILKNDDLPDGQDPYGNTEKLLERRRRAIGEKKENDQ
ncbi:PadR family transcriptional regulator [Bacillus sp. ISL-47]|uniref:PadR family transcriptional regulator n=1 Tax=Bacillus sp. ISL-47 TaxID=2819130 RepID=UPI001BEA578D|nr:PadR family transcriptional regulator [Bacillus sp. ISL-47]MBT2687823.1 PadR family transcriptional regulator [Bacillus sp. ISL-47]MBT2708100.1 PadR family transcriptional regulator [Pseudomonas sp. ISL-84]